MKSGKKSNFAVMVALFAITVLGVGVTVVYAENSNQLQRNPMNWIVDFNSFYDVNWNVDFSQIFDGEIFIIDGSSQANQSWRDRFSSNGRLVTIYSTFYNSKMVRGVVLFENQVIILNNSQYIILDDIETINHIMEIMNIDINAHAIRFFNGYWENIEPYLPFVSNETIEKLVEIYNSTRPTNQHKNASIMTLM